MARPEEVRHIVEGAGDWKKKENLKKNCQVLIGRIVLKIR
jgi:hypothetical protein